ncbi:MAG: 4Fe-4S binding protein, partial [Methanoregula sp.]|nr:4Fe-4S binding protein [Methanoregula sp.]
YGNESQGMVLALVYLVAGTVLTAYLWHTGVMSRRIILALAAESALAGFVFLAPIMPLEFIGLVNTITGMSTPTAGIVILCGVIAVTFITGRTFCGHICPVGSLQELVYAVPVKKIAIRHTEYPELARLGVFIVTVIAAICVVDLMAYTGLYELFSLAVSAVLVIALGLVMLSVFLYRPVCRLICPFGVLFSIPAEFSRFRLRRNNACISCKKCEKACPVHIAGKDDAKRECYLCGRCTGSCPVETAISYRS